MENTRKICSKTLGIGLVALLACLSLSPRALATLGERADSIGKDRHALSAAQRSSTDHLNYTVQEAASGATAIREYLSPSGVVFAVAWNGRVHPNLAPLLGSYAREFQDAKRQIPRKHGQKRLKIRTARVVVETWGHMRDLHGRAYLPALLPGGVRVDEIN